MKERDSVATKTATFFAPPTDWFMADDTPLPRSSHGLIPNPFVVVFFLRIFRERPPTTGKAVPTFKVG